MFLQGQKVVCVDDKFPAWVYKVYAQLPVKGQTYTVRMLSLGQAADLESGKLAPDTVVYLEELHNPDDPMNTKNKIELAFKVERFVPLEEMTTEEILDVERPEVLAY